MEGGKNAETNLDVARKLQEKYEWYFLALIFTVLGLSVQTAKLGHSFGADIFEVMGWVSLLVSGIAGLSRVELAPKQYLGFDMQQDIRQMKAAVQNVSMTEKTIYDRSAGRDRPIADVLKEIDERTAVINAKTEAVAK